MASYVSLPESDIGIREEASELAVEWKIPKVLPKLPVFSEGVFFIGAPQSGSVEFQCSIYAENVSQPTRITLSVVLEKIHKDLFADEIEKLNQAFTYSDLATGTGRTRFIPRGVR